MPRRVSALVRGREVERSRCREVEVENGTEERATWRWTDVGGDKIYYRLDFDLAETTRHFVKKISEAFCARQWSYSSRVPTEAWMEGGMPKSVCAT